MTALLFDGSTARAREVTVALEAGRLVIHDPAAGTSLIWPLAALRRRDGSDRARDVVSLRGRDPARLVLDDPVLRAALGKRIGRGGPARVLPWIAASLLGLALLAWLAVARLPGWIAPLVPHALSDRLGALAEASVLRAHPACAGKPGIAALDGLEARIARAAGLRRPVVVTVANDPVANAFALPGHRIVVLRGLIAEAANGDELAGVLAHETAHIAHLDPITAAIRGLGLNVLGNALGVGGGASAPIGGALIGLAYSRDVEARADRSAVVYLRRAGLRADGLARFLARMEARHPDGGLPPFLADHPPLAQREAAAAAGSAGAPALGPRGWAAPRAVC
ncbi:MAG: M48 family metallopeptidase, partial [Rhodospirillales bacterium]|nr:M48 family metallopeptidase [Rhodospirillales bacterium]